MKTSTAPLVFASLLLFVATQVTLAFDNNDDDDRVMEFHRKLHLTPEQLQDLTRHLRGNGHNMKHHGGGETKCGDNDQENDMMMMMGNHNGGGMMGNHYGNDEMMMGGGGGMVGGLSEEEHDTIMYLVDHNDVIQRDWELVNDGVHVTTISNTSEVSAALHRHVYQMTHLEKGRRVRQCDPLYRALFDHYNETTIEVTNTSNGVVVRHAGQTPCAQVLVMDHTKTVDRFVKTGCMRPDFDWQLPQECTEQQPSSTSASSLVEDPTEQEKDHK